MKWAILASLAVTCGILGYAGRPAVPVMPANMPTVGETRAILLDCERRNGRQCVFAAVPVMQFSTTMRGD